MSAQQRLQQAVTARRLRKQQASSSHIATNKSNSTLDTPWEHTDTELLAILIALHIVAKPIPHRRMPTHIIGGDGSTASPLLHDASEADRVKRQQEEFEFVTSRVHHDFHEGHFLRNSFLDLENMVDNARRGSHAGGVFHQLLTGKTVEAQEVQP
jgi:hypothetical protein